MAFSYLVYLRGRCTPRGLSTCVAVLLLAGLTTAAIPVRDFEQAIAVAGRFAPADGPALSPDGQRIASCAGLHLSIHDLDSAEILEVPDSRGALAPFWSISGTRVAYFRRNDTRALQLVLVEAASGASFTLIPDLGELPCNLVELPLGGCFTGPGSLVVALGPLGLWSVSTRDGSRQRLPATEAPVTAVFTPTALPADGSLLFAVQFADASHGLVQRNAEGDEQVLLRTASRVLHPCVREGQVLFTAYATAPRIHSLALDLQGTASLEETTAIAEAGWRPSVSTDGSLLFARSGESAPESWFQVQANGLLRGPVAAPPPPNSAALPEAFQQRQGAVLSQDGVLVAYEEEDATGLLQIFVAPATDPTQCRQASTAGGRMARWMGSHGKLAFLSGETLVTVDVTFWKGMQLTRPYPRFTGTEVGADLAATDTCRYAVAASGSGFLVRRPPEAGMGTSLVLRGQDRSAPATATTNSTLPAEEDPSLARVRSWRRDLDYLAREVPRSHRSAFHACSRDQYFAFLQRLYRDIPSLSDPQIYVRISQLIALLGDGHSSFALPSAPGFHFLPLALYWFDDGVFVTAAPAEQEELIGARIRRIGDTPIEEACRRLTTLCSRDNEMGARLRVPLVMVLGEALEALDLVADFTQALFEFETESGEQRVVTMSAGPRRDPASFRTAPMLLDTGTPLFLEQKSRSWWHTYLPDAATMYVQYNACTNDPLESFAAYCRRLFRDLDNSGAERLVVDLRHNSGGNGMLNQPLIDGVLARPQLDQEGHLYVLTGRRTFSAAGMCAVDFEQQTRALFAGEPMGARPNSYSETGRLTLPEAGTRFMCSRLFWQLSAPDDERPWIEPDLPVDYLFEDYLSGFDPVLETVLDTILEQ